MTPEFRDALRQRVVQAVLLPAFLILRVGAVFALVVGSVRALSGGIFFPVFLVIGIAGFGLLWGLAGLVKDVRKGTLSLAEPERPIERPSRPPEREGAPSQTVTQKAIQRDVGEPGTPSSTNVLFEVSRHVTSLGSIAAILFLLVKALGVSRYSITTALALISASPASVVVGIITFYAYLLLPLLALVAASWFLSLIPGRGADQRSGVALGLTVLAVLLSPVDYLLRPAAALAVYVGLFCAIPWALGRGWSFRSNVFTWYVIILVVWIFVATIESPWLPAEVIVRKDRPPTIAHVLGSDDGSLTFLRSANRVIIRAPSEDVLGRGVCHWQTPRPSKPLYYWILGRSYESSNLSCARVVWCVERELPSLPASGDDTYKRELAITNIEYTRDETCEQTVRRLSLPLNNRLQTP